MALSTLAARKEQNLRVATQLVLLVAGAWLSVNLPTIFAGSGRSDLPPPIADINDPLGDFAAVLFYHPSTEWVRVSWAMLPVALGAVGFLMLSRADALRSASATYSHFGRAEPPRNVKVEGEAATFSPTTSEPHRVGAVFAGPTAAAALLGYLYGRHRRRC
jgi:hypothetical protein